MNSLPKEIICNIMNYLENTVNVIFFSLSNYKKQKYLIVSTSNKFLDKIDKLNIIGELCNSNIYDISNLRNIKKEIYQNVT